MFDTRIPAIWIPKSEPPQGVMARTVGHFTSLVRNLAKRLGFLGTKDDWRGI
jgi:hypothetical protein